MTDRNRVTALNRIAWDAAAMHHGAGDYWTELVAGFADPAYSRFDETMANALRGAGIETTAITYDGSDHSAAPESHWFIPMLSAIVQAILDAGLSLTTLQEFPHSIREVDYDIYRDQAAQVPMSFLLRADKTS